MENANKNYEWVELPSKGQCYPIDSPLRKGKVKVTYLTAKDENMMASQKLIEEGKVCDSLLKAKVKDVDSTKLCAGDKEAIVLWLRRTGYGDTYNVLSSDKTIDLNKVKYKEFKLIPNEDGHFYYYLDNGQKLIFQYLPYKEEDALIRETVNVIKENTDKENSYNDIYRRLTMPLLLGMIVSIDGLSDIRKWLFGLDNDRLRRIQRYMTKNEPGLDINTTDGLVFDDAVFYDIRV